MKPEDEMRVFHEPEPDYGRDALTFGLGAIGGLAIGILLSRRAAPEPGRGLRSQLRERARSVARRIRPGRLQRLEVEQAALNDLEDAVLDSFLADEVLSERGIDVGAISPGIIELSGSVFTEEEAERAVRVANATMGVRTVVNRLDVEDEARHFERTRRRMAEEGSGLDALVHGHGKTGGMGSSRVSRGRDPDQRDDSQYRKERALFEADQQQWMDEGYAHENPALTSRPEVQDPWRTNFSEDELDNQDPHGKHAANTLDEDPQELNSSARVGEGLKPGEHLRLEQADVPMKRNAGRDDND